jgi:hypothetical protein
MAVESAPHQTRVCPPHYWLIERVALHTEHWICQRCGAQQEHQDAPKLPHRWVPARIQPQKT